MEFAELQTALNDAAALAPASEVHGMLCGAVCSGAGQREHWQGAVFGDEAGGAEVQESCGQSLERLRDGVQQQLEAADMEFAPLLPEDPAPLARRVEALAGWCQGFLFGLGLGASRAQLDALTDEAGEVLRDLTEMTRAGSAPGAEDEEDERAYVELVEYLRVAVQILYEALNQPRPDSTSNILH